MSSNRYLNSMSSILHNSVITCDV